MVTKTLDKSREGGMRDERQWEEVRCLLQAIRLLQVELHKDELDYERIETLCLNLIRQFFAYGFL